MKYYEAYIPLSDDWAEGQESVCLVRAPDDWTGELRAVIELLNATTWPEDYAEGWEEEFALSPADEDEWQEGLENFLCCVDLCEGKVIEE